VGETTLPALRDSSRLLSGGGTMKSAEENEGDRCGRHIGQAKEIDETGRIIE